MCGITPLLLPLLLVILCLAGCLQKAEEPVDISLPNLEGTASPRLQLDFDAEVSSLLFRVQGNLMMHSNVSLPYLILNATLHEGKRPLKSIRYMMIDAKPNQNHVFEISKSMRIPSGSYNCSLEVSGPNGPLICETRRCIVNGPWEQPSLVAPPIFRRDPPRADAEEKDRAETISQKNVDAFEKDASEPSQRSDSLQKDSEESRRLMGNNESSVSKEKEKFDIVPEAVAANGLEGESKLVGSSSSKKYHRSNCRYVSKIKPENRVLFTSREEAKIQGYLPCKVCAA
jgi:hypothetical protein